MQRRVTPTPPAASCGRFQHLSLFVDVCDARLGEETPQQYGTHQV